MKRCRDCKNEISEQALTCPWCGAPYPTREKWDGWGFEYKSKTKVLGLPLVHIAFKYRPNGKPVMAKGVVAIGQFGAGIISITQFGIGVFSVSQFAIAVYALAQFAVAYSCIAQIGLYFDQGYGQVVRKLSSLLGAF